nr:sperm-associated antigen 11-like [Equus asinus]
MMQSLPRFALLLMALLFPGSARASYVNQQGTKGPREPREESPRRGTSRAHMFRLLVEDYLLPRTPPYEDPEPDFKIVNCKRSEGYCQEYCNYMEVQVGYCSKKKDACCLHPN